jgi:3-dehydroquinate synthase
MTPVYFDKEAVAELQKYVRQIENQQKRLFILCDENTLFYCLPILQKQIVLPIFELMTVPAGEADKTIATASRLWEQLLAKNADKGSILLCLGGGMISDLGGFVAATFKRGIDCVFVPTSLMAQVDAAIGGKNAVNLGYAKNQIGLFYPPRAIFLFTQFLQTLPEKEIRSGYVEMLKHGLIADKDYWNELKNIKSISQITDIKYIKKSVEIKSAICQADEKEENVRKKLNFGHTVGHSLEAFFLSKNTPLPHGEAVAMGIVAESHLSWLAGLLDENSLMEITHFFQEKFAFPQVDKKDRKAVAQFLYADKKRRNQSLNFTFLKQIGDAVINQQAKEEDILSSLSKLELVQC